MSTQAIAQPAVRTFHRHGATEIRLTLLTQQEQDEACTCTVGKGPKPEEHPAVKGCPSCRGSGVVKKTKGHRLDVHVVDVESVMVSAKEIQGHALPSAPAKLFSALDALGYVAANCDDVAAECPDGTVFTLTAANLADVLAGKTLGELPKEE